MSIDLAVAEKKESQEICFVPDGNYAGFIDRYLEAEQQTDRLPGAGEIVTAGGEVIGQHPGIHRYTIGQRRGIGIADARPLYVLNVDSRNESGVVGYEDELLSDEFTAAGVNWIAFDNPTRAGARGSARALPSHGRARDDHSARRQSRFALTSTSRNAPSRRARRPCSIAAMKSGRRLDR